MEATETAAAPQTGWHRYSEPGERCAYDTARCPEVDTWWWPAITTYGGPQLSPHQTISYSRWEAADAIRAALRRGLAVAVWDASPTCTSRLVFAAGPCSPLTCPIGRRMRGAGPRYS